jgi:hypothetical protein
MEAICASESSLLLNRVHGVIFQKMILFITTAVRTSNPAKFSSSFLANPGTVLP